MPDLRCSECGRIVRVQGLAATCPYCGNLVMVAPVSSGSPDAADTVQGIEPPLAQVYVPPASPIDASIPPPAPPFRSVANPARQTHVGWYVLGAIATLVVLLIAIDWIRLRFFANPAPTVATTAPAPAPPQPKPATKPRSIFNDDDDNTAGAAPTANAAARNSRSSSPASSSPPSPAQSSPPPSSALASSRPSGPPWPFESLANINPTPPTRTRGSHLTDAQIGESIQRAVNYLHDEFSGSRLRGGDQTDPETFAGRNALAIYALLHAGQAINDPRLGRQTEFIRGLLDRVKEFPMNGNVAVYSRALRISALGVYNRAEDRATLEGDARYLLDAAVSGAFTYQAFEKDRRPTGSWEGYDNSNSQYGVLGLWAAAEAGYRVPNVFWSEVESHWTNKQTATGGWGYKGFNSNASLAMTSAGITSLFVARDQMLGNASELPANTDSPRAIARGIEWLDEGDHSIDIGGSGHPGYTLYGLERAGLAGGYKYFGTHDWYLELAAKRLADQKPDGSWEGGDGVHVETAFTILFLARGRHPVLLSKLQFDGNWANNARDLANLTRFAGKQLERPLNWQVVSLNRQWQEWTDSAVLYLATDKPPALTDGQIQKLRSFTEASGLLFVHADRDSAETAAFAGELAARLFPKFHYEPIAEDHPIYSALYPMKVRPQLFGVSNGVRLLMICSPKDLGRAWQRRLEKPQRTAFELGVNVAIYAAGRRELRNRIESLFIPDAIESPVATVPVARLKFNGNWDPEPWAWQRFPRAMENETRVHVTVNPTDLAELKIETAPLAVLTGVGSFSATEADVNAVRNFLQRGGILFVDSCGGGKPFAEAVRAGLISKLAPGQQLVPVSTDHPLLREALPGMLKLTPLQTRSFTVEALGEAIPQLQTMRVGSGMVIFSDLDVTSGLLGTATWGIVGYQPQTSNALMRNVILWSLRPPPRP